MRQGLKKYCTRTWSFVIFSFYFVIFKFGDALFSNYVEDMILVVFYFSFVVLSYFRGKHWKMGTYTVFIDFSYLEVLPHNF